VWVASPASRAPVLQEIEELARTSIKQVLKLLDGNDRFQSQTQYRMMWGSEDSKTGGWTHMRAYKQVAMAKLDLNKTQMFMVEDKEYMTGGGRPHKCWGRSLLTVDYRIKVHMDLQADKSPVVVKGPFFPRVVNPRYRIRGIMCNARIQSNKAR
jgi:hypothetical protein